jgi:hypothetical protein
MSSRWTSCRDRRHERGVARAGWRSRPSGCRCPPCRCATAWRLCAGPLASRSSLGRRGVVCPSASRWGACWSSSVGSLTRGMALAMGCPPGEEEDGDAAGSPRHARPSITIHITHRKPCATYLSPDRRVQIYRSPESARPLLHGLTTGYALHQDLALWDQIGKGC